MLILHYVGGDFILGPFNFIQIYIDYKLTQNKIFCY
jgi:hypothetical protein